jgi:thermolysin
MQRFRRYAVLSLLASCASAAGCSSDPDAGAPDLASRLEQDTGVTWTVYADPRSHEVRFLAPRTPVAIGTGTPEEKARAFFARYRDALHASDRADEVRLVSSATDMRGGIHIRFEHFLPGTSLPVFDVGSTAHFTADGAVYWLETDFRAELPALDAHASVTKEAALTAAVAHVQASCGTLASTPTATLAELGVLSDPSLPVTLAYRVPVAVRSTDCVAPQVVVDAKSGLPIRLEEHAHAADAKAYGSRLYPPGNSDDLKTINVRSKGTTPPRYEMFSEGEPGRRVVTHDFNSGAIIETADPVVWDAAARGAGAGVDAHFHTSIALEFLRRRTGSFMAHGKVQGSPLFLDVQVFVHDNSAGEENAGGRFDMVTGQDSVFFGDGGYPAVANQLPLSAAYDVVAHEVAHLVTSHTSQLLYALEPGALNESFSDAMAASAEHERTPNDAKNFTIGEDIFVEGIPGRRALRSMTAPRSVRDGNDESSPDHTDDTIKCGGAPTKNNDFCGVHRNSGIPNRAFSLLVAGGPMYKFAAPNPPQLRAVGVPMGIGWAPATEIVYWATTGLTASALFENAALAQIAEAGVVGATIGVDRAAVNALTAACAWYAVGVYKPTAITQFTTVILDAYCKPLPAAAPTPPPAPPPQGVVASNICSGHGDSLVCDPTEPAQAIVCKSGIVDAMSSGVLCADLAQRCKPTSAGDPTAMIDANGVIVCE